MLDGWAQQRMIDEVSTLCRDVSHALDGQSRTAADTIAASANHISSLAAEVRGELTRPAVLYRPRLSLDGNVWCMLLGDSLQEGVAGFGDSPAKAADAFDIAWHSTTKELTRIADLARGQQ